MNKAATARHHDFLPSEVNRQADSGAKIIKFRKKIKCEVRNIDCIDGLKSLAENSVSMVLTDPPYFKWWHCKCHARR